MGYLMPILTIVTWDVHNASKFTRNILIVAEM